jgi:hypothetical protein
MLRQAFKDTPGDKDYLADLKRANLTSKYIGGETVEKFVGQIYAPPPELQPRLEFTVQKRKLS